MYFLVLFTHQKEDYKILRKSYVTGYQHVKRNKLDSKYKYNIFSFLKNCKDNNKEVERERRLWEIQGECKIGEEYNENPLYSCIKTSTWNSLFAQLIVVANVKMNVD